MHECNRGSESKRAGGNKKKETQSCCKQWADYIAPVSMVTERCHMRGLIKGLRNCTLKKVFFFFFRLKKIFHRSHIYEDQRIRMSENAGHWEREQETKIHFNK